MTLSVKDASGATQTIKTNDDMAGAAGTPSANVLSVQGVAGGSVVAVSAVAPAAAFVERSGTIASGGTAQTLAASNASRRWYRVMNLSTGDLWINDRGATAAAAQPAFKLVAGAMYETGSVAPAAAISIFGATTGQAFSAAEA
ncbi:MAG: hypothetical protein ABL901_17800 [Hyphomicrobiaceae bacterium]